MADREYRWALPDAEVHFTVSAASDRGAVRRINEDSFVAEPPVFLVADGMGGHAHGDRASQTVARVFQTELVPGVPAAADGVLRAIDGANRLVREIGEESFAGTTVAAVVVVADARSGGLQWMAVNLGDSRIYEVREGRLSQLSVDHSAIQELIEDGALLPEEAATHPDRNVVTRAVGAVESPEPDIWLRSAEGVHRYLICSDGLTKELDDVDIERVLATAGERGIDSAHALVAAALEHGGHDNVTAVVVESRLTTGGSAEPHAIDPLLEETQPRDEA